MARVHSGGASALAFDAITVEGPLIAPAMLARIAKHDAGEQGEADYGIPKGLTLRDEIARYFRIGQALHVELTASKSPSIAATTGFAERLLHDVFGFADIRRGGIRTWGDRQFAVTLEALAGRVPVVVVPPADDIDRPSAVLTIDDRRRSATSAIQEWLNASSEAGWGMCSNGTVLRLVRDNASLTRPAYIEADLRRIFEDEAFADFAALWLLIHASRLGKPGTPTSDCALERWREAAQKEGVAARDRLRDGVEAALLSLGNGFLGHSENGSLRERLRTGELPLPAFFGQLLRFVYRLIFLLAAEDRNLLHAPAASAAARKLYAEGYSVGALRDRAVRRTAWNRHHDRWEGLLITFAALAHGEPRLGLPGLDGLFARGTIPALEDAKLANRSLMEAIYRLAWLKEASGLVPVNWRDMETEELGSVYESLLELTPRLTDDGRGFAFVEGGEAQGHARKTTGSYYTPDSLVQALLELALNPVLDRVEAEADAAAALLTVNVLDPACGSGHFLLAAARRIATRLARARAGGVASPADYRRALRDVVRTCVYGVDRNPMAVELTKVALWIETVEPGKPLGFLDANIRCGDALFGVFDLKVLQHGIPNTAYEPLLGDDKETARHFARRNRSEREGQGSVDFAAGGGRLPVAAPLAAEVRVLRTMSEDSPEEIAAKRKRFEADRADPRRGNLQIAADLYTAAFLVPKIGGVPANGHTAMIPTTEHVWNVLAGRAVHEPMVSRAQEFAGAARAFHWPLEFPDILGAGGFGVVLGNPPWDTMSPDVKEFFSKYDEQIRFLSPADQKTRMTSLLEAPGVREAWDAHCRHLYVSANFMRESGRYKLFAEGNLGKGDFNVYRMFVELALFLVRGGGRAAQFVPENLYNGANATAIRRYLFEKCHLHALIGFENTKKVWFDIDSRAKFCLYAASPGTQTTEFAAAFGVNTVDKLLALHAGLPFDIPVSLVEEFSPEALAIAEVAHPHDIAISRKLYARYPKFGADLPDLARREYMREIDMGNDREDFDDDPSGLPVYEGRMVDAFDHRAKAYVSGRGRSAVWRELPFSTPDKAIIPQWRLPDSKLPSKLTDRYICYRICFCDVGGVTNSRFLTAALIPPRVVCGHSVPTIVFDPPDHRLMMLWIGVANSFVLDFLARKKSANHMTFTIMDSLPLPRVFNGTPLERSIASRALRLAAAGPEMAEFWRKTAQTLGINLSAEGPVEDVETRNRLRAEIDVLVARDLFGLTRDEMRYLLDPSDILGADCSFETFGALKRADERECNGRFRTRDFIVDVWDHLELPTVDDAPQPSRTTREPRAV
jgi:hypothetical protein